MRDSKIVVDFSPPSVLIYTLLHDKWFTLTIFTSVSIWMVCIKNCLYLHLYNLRDCLLLTVKMFWYKIFEFVLMLDVKSCEHDDLHIFMSRVRHLSPSIGCQIKHLNPNNSSDFSKQKHCHHYHSANIHNIIVLRFILPFHLVVCWLAL